MHNFQEKIRRNDPAVKHPVDATIVLLRPLPPGRGCALYASVSPYEPDNTLFIGILDQVFSPFFSSLSLNIYIYSFLFLSVYVFLCINLCRSGWFILPCGYHCNILSNDYSHNLFSFVILVRCISIKVTDIGSDIYIYIYIYNTHCLWGIVSVLL